MVDTLLVCLILTLNAQVFESMGRMFGELAGASGIAVGVTFSSIFSQTLVIAGGFYKTVDFPLFSWISAINGIKYGFTAIERLYFSHQDSFLTTPNEAQAAHGYTWSSLEMMNVFTTLRSRGVVVVDSLDPPSIAFPVGMLVVLIFAFRTACFAIAVFHGWREAEVSMSKAQLLIDNEEEQLTHEAIKPMTSFIRYSRRKSTMNVVELKQLLRVTDSPLTSKKAEIPSKLKAGLKANAGSHRASLSMAQGNVASRIVLS